MIPPFAPHPPEEASGPSGGGLLAGLAAGEESSWRLFLEEYAGLVLAVAGKTGLGEEEREDVLQQVCLAVLRSAGSLRDPAKLSTWVYGIAYRQSMDVWRRRARLPRHEEASAPPALERLPDPAPDLVHDLISLESAALLRDALALLEARCRRLLQALYLEDPSPSYETISRRESMPIGSIGPTRARCLKKLRDLVSRAGIAPTNG